tara:strand:+ start:62 stop:463 length:402 start_codon:yes stop_codon:yes gene_type:complete
LPAERIRRFAVVRGAIPAELMPGTIYVNPQGNRAHHLCACGCGMRVMTPLNAIEWELLGPDEYPSLYPSVGNWNLACQSHYFVSRGAVRWARRFTTAEIEACWRKDSRPYRRHRWLEVLGKLFAKAIDRLRGK